MSLIVPNRILVTGTTGFVGKAFADYLDKFSFEVVRVDRGKNISNDSSHYTIGNINSSTEWIKVLNGVSTVVHCAARVHVMKESAKDPYAAFHEVNVAGTLNLAQQAHACGVKRFVYVSSVKVNGEKTYLLPFSETDTPCPEDDYGRSKYEAELGLFAISEKCGLEVVIVRPPLIYGPCVSANFLKLLGLVGKRIPLPFGSLRCKRSLIFRDNLLDFLKVCIEHPRAVGEVFLVSDGDDYTFPELLRQIAKVMGSSVRLFSCPSWLLYFFGRCIGKNPEMQRLCSSLQVDISKAKEQLDWSPPYPVATGLNKTVTWFLSTSKRKNVSKTRP